MIDAASRDKTACMMRCRNEARWIRRSLERTFEVAKTVVILDDGSTDGMYDEAVMALGEDTITVVKNGVDVVHGPRGFLHYILSPFRKGVVREREAVNEIRDKNFLWWYCKACVDFTYMLCLDGDEMLSRKALDHWPEAIEQMRGGVDLINMPFIYLWDSETLRRVDGIYGDLEPDFARLNFPRLFSIARVDEADLFDMMFKWEGTKGGFHCGSIPRQAFRVAPDRTDVFSVGLKLPVVHFGYIDDSLRRTKFEFYNLIDPHNTFEGEYKHIIGEPDVHAPGPVQLISWEDT